MRNDIAGKRISCKPRKLQAKLATVKVGPLAEARASGCSLQVAR
jgi:hypothetical protein